MVAQVCVPKLFGQLNQQHCEFKANLGGLVSFCRKIKVNEWLGMWLSSRMLVKGVQSPEFDP